MKRYHDAPFIHADVIEAQRYEYVVPAATFTPSWTGVSALLGRAPFNNTEAFALRLPITAPDGDFVFCVSWESDGVVYRMRLWDAGVSLYNPVYDGSTISATNAYLEVWSTADADAVIAEDFTLYSSQMIERDDPTDSTPSTQPSEVITLEFEV